MAFTSDYGTNRALDWDRLLDLAQKEARTVPGKNLLEKLRDPKNWAPEITTAKLQQQETQEVTPLLDRDALWGPLVELSDPSSSLERLSRGSILEIEELVVLRRWLY